MFLPVRRLADRESNLIGKGFLIKAFENDILNKWDFILHTFEIIVDKIKTFIGLFSDC